MTPPLDLTREPILAYRRAVQALDARLPLSPAALGRAAHAGLQDSMPRAALLSLHARVADIESTAWEHPAFVQLWGLRFSAYVVATEDVPVFTVGRSPDDAESRRFAEGLADRIDSSSPAGACRTARWGAPLGSLPIACGMPPRRAAS